MLDVEPEKSPATPWISLEFRIEALEESYQADWWQRSPSFSLLSTATDTENINQHKLTTEYGTVYYIILRN